MKNFRKRYGKKVCISLLVLIAGMAVVTVHAQTVKQEETEEADLEAKRDLIREIYTEEYQQEVSDRLEEAKAGGNYTEDTMLIEPNPYGTNSLSLYVYFQTKEEAQVSYTVSVEDENIADFTADENARLQEEETEDSGTAGKTEHEFQVIGLVPDHTNTVTFTITYADGSQVTREYKHNPGSVLGEEEIQLEVTDVKENCEEELSDGLYVILGNDSDGLDFMYYYDTNGVLRGEVPIIGYRSHRILFWGDNMYYSISTTKIAAVNPLGKVEKIYDTGTYKLHHDYTFDEEGNLIVLATDTQSNTVEDRIIRIDHETGEITDVFDLVEVLGNYKELFTDADAEDLDWMHINTLQWLGDQTVILSSRETSSILKISGIFETPKIDYIIGEEEFWEGTGYEDLVLEKDESGGTFSGTGGQHTVTYETSGELADGEYYLYMFNNNLGYSESREYDWTRIDGIATSIDEESVSYYYKYLVNEAEGTYELVQSFEVPFSPYVSSAQEYDGNIIVDSGMKGIFGEYDQEGGLLRQFQMELADRYIYRVYKYHF